MTEAYQLEQKARHVRRCALETLAAVANGVLASTELLPLASHAPPACTAQRAVVRDAQRVPQAVVRHPRFVA